MQKEQYIHLFETLWHRIVEIERGGELPPGGRDAEFSELVFKKIDIGNLNVNDYLLRTPFQTTQQGKRYFYRRYRDALNGIDEISIHWDVLYNVLHYLGYRLEHIKDYSTGFSVDNAKQLLAKFEADSPVEPLSTDDTKVIKTNNGADSELTSKILSILEKMSGQPDKSEDFNSLMDVLQFEDDTEDLKKNITFLLNSYSEEVDLLRKGDIFAPYTIIHDYRKSIPDGWGTYSFEQPFELNPVLQAGYQDAVDSNRASLGKGNLATVRVKDVSRKNDVMDLTIQPAQYFQQVASNFILDKKMPHGFFPTNSAEIDTIRKWDMAQAGVQDRFPSYSKSILANTIGVAVAVYTLNDNHQKVYLTRKRTNKTVMTFKDTEHLIFSFALKIHEGANLSSKGTIKDLIRPSFEKEQMSELGFLDKSFERVRPLAFCREMQRGGKPQFFLEMELKESYDELKKKIAEKDEKGNTDFVPEYLPDTLNGDLSFNKFDLSPNTELKKVISFIKSKRISSELFASLLLAIQQK